MRPRESNWSCVQLHDLSGDALEAQAGLVVDDVTGLGVAVDAGACVHGEGRTHRVLQLLPHGRRARHACPLRLLTLDLASTTVVDHLSPVKYCLFIGDRNSIVAGTRTPDFVRTALLGLTAT